jgi:hypothetical protein
MLRVLTALILRKSQEKNQIEILERTQIYFKLQNSNNKILLDLDFKL